MGGPAYDQYDVIADEYARTFAGEFDVAAVCTALEATGFTVYATTRRTRLTHLAEPTDQAMVIASTSVRKLPTNCGAPPSRHARSRCEVQP